MLKVTFKYGEITKEVADSKERPAKMRRIVFRRLRIVSFNAERYIKFRMPVDTGRARSSWGHATAPASPDDGIWEENEDSLRLVQGSNLEYIDALNNGHSAQAPAGFIDVEAARAANDFEKGLEKDMEGLL